MSERQQLLYEIAGYLGRPNPTVWEQLVDALAFALMAVVAWLNRRVWRKVRVERRLIMVERVDPEDRYRQARWDMLAIPQRMRPQPTREPRLLPTHDGWKAARYV